MLIQACWSNDRLHFKYRFILSVFIISGIIALLLIVLQKKTKLAGDALLGLLAHSSLAIGLVFIAILTTIRFDLMGLLLGDILSVTPNDIIIIWFGGSLILLILFYIGNPCSQQQ